MKLKHLIKLLSLILVLILLGCSEEIYENQHSLTNKNEISFKQFKLETGIKNFKTNNSYNFGGANNRSLPVDFVVDTTLILNHIAGNTKKTYTFKLYPLTQTLNQHEYYNLVYEKNGNSWNQLIFKNTETFNQISQTYTTSTSTNVYNAKGAGLSIECATMNIDFHCVGGGTCTMNHCDLCALCMSTSVSYGVCESGGFDGGGQNGSGDSNSGGGGGEDGEYEPLPYDNNVNHQSSDFINTPCGRLMKGTSRRTFEDKFALYINPVRLNASQESGFFEKKDATTGNIIMHEGVANGRGALLVPVGALNYTHVHPYREGRDENNNSYNQNINMPSPMDLQILIKDLSAENTTAGLPVTDAFGITITNEGIFSLTMAEPLTQLEIATYVDNYEKFKLAYDDKASSIVLDDLNPVQRKNKMKEMFMNFLKEVNLDTKINFFEGTVTRDALMHPSISWDKIGKDDTGKIISTKC